MPRIYGASDRQTNAFNGFYRALLRQEMGHYNIGGETAFAIDYALTAMLPMQNCALLQEEANGRAYALLRESQKKVIHYDEQTKHGRLQGAAFNELLALAYAQGVPSHNQELSRQDAADQHQQRPALRLN